MSFNPRFYLYSPFPVTSGNERATILVSRNSGLSTRYRVKFYLRCTRQEINDYTGFIVPRNVLPRPVCNRVNPAAPYTTRNDSRFRRGWFITGTKNIACTTESAAYFTVIPFLPRFHRYIRPSRALKYALLLFRDFQPPIASLDLTTAPRRAATYQSHFSYSPLREYPSGFRFIKFSFHWFFPFFFQRRKETLSYRDEVRSRVNRCTWVLVVRNFLRVYRSDFFKK